MYNDKNIAQGHKYCRNVIHWKEGDENEKQSKEDRGKSVLKFAAYWLPQSDQNIFPNESTDLAVVEMLQFHDDRLR